MTSKLIEKAIYRILSSLCSGGYATTEIAQEAFRARESPTTAIGDDDQVEKKNIVLCHHGVAKLQRYPFDFFKSFLAL